MAFLFECINEHNISYKECRLCKVSKSIAEFPKHIAHKDNLDSRCRECKTTTSKTLKRLHKLAPEKPELCECCGNIPEENKWRLDHDHITGNIRGWVCDSCNLGIGALGDNIEGLERAIEYLKKYKYSKQENSHDS